MNTCEHKVSIIIAIYNAGEHLKRCIDSVMAQTLKEIQIILVLDCPTDGSDIVAKEFAQKDNRIVIIENKKNLHIGLSRNEGLKVADGEYVAFADHDDYMEPWSLEHLYCHAKKHDADIVFSPISRWFVENDNKSLPEIRMTPPMNCKDFAIRQILGDEKVNESKIRFYQVHGSLYRNQIIGDNSLVFVDTKQILPEDALFNLRALMNARNVLFLNEHLYFHVQTGQNTGSKLSYFDWDKRCKGIDYIRNFITSNTDGNYENLIGRFTVQTLSNIMLEIASRRKIIMLIKVISKARRTTHIKQSFRSNKQIGRSHRVVRNILSFLIVV